MARVLTCWEMGNGLAYIEGLAAGARAIKKAGHEVQFALRDLGHAERVLGGKFTYYQAPTQVLSRGMRLANPMTFADVLINLGFDDAQAVTARTRAWRALFDQVKPDIIRCANAPGALLAARGTGIRVIVVGLGFIVPPPVSPLPKLRSWAEGVPERMAAREQTVLDACNQALKALGAPEVAGVGALYAGADVTELYTYPELDDYGPRQGVKYLGNFQPGFGATPEWPAGSGKRIFAYLDLYEPVPQVLQALADTGARVLAYLPRAPEALTQRYATGNLRLTSQPLNVAEAAAQCDVGVNHGGHNIVGSFLYAGKPQLCLPWTFPEGATSRKLLAMGTGLISPIQPQEMREQLTRLLGDAVLARKAADYGASVSHLTPEAALKGAAASVDELAKLGPRRG